jgi:hypothetical protein
MDFTKSLFTGLPFKNLIPEDAKCVVVADFFKEDLAGGAELTTDALLSKAPIKLHKIRAQNLSSELVKENKDKYWIITNFANMQSDVILSFINTTGVRYSIVEYDFKYCTYRSPFKHFLETNNACDCPNSEHGSTIKRLYSKADKIFWMAEKQRDHYLDIWPTLDVPGKNVIQTSTFSDETLSKLSLMRNIFKNSEERKNKVWAVQISNSWIKGSKETLLWAQRNGLNVKPIGNMQYEQFLVELAKSYGLVLRPLDSDTCPRVVIEARLLGCELEINKHVLHANEAWFTGSVEDIEKYLRSRADSFWKTLTLF